MQQTMNKDAEGYDDNMTEHDDGWDDTEEWLGEDHTILGKDALLPFQVMSESDLLYSQYIKYGVFLTRQDFTQANSACEENKNQHEKLFCFINIIK